MSFHPRSPSILAQVRFLAYHRIKPHAPPLVRTPANSFEFQSCDRTSQVGYLMLSLRHQQCIADVEYPSFRAWTTRVSNPVCSPTLSCLSVNDRVVSCLRNWCSMSYLSISPLHDIFRLPPRYSRLIVSTAVSKLSLEISPRTYQPAYAPFKPSESG